MSESIIGSKEVAVIAIAFVIGKSVEMTGVSFPLTADQVYQAGLAIAGIIRILWTQGKISSLLPKNKVET